MSEKEKEKNQNDIDVYHIENLKLIVLPYDMTKITEKTREAIYYLRSLITHETIYLGIKNQENSKFQLLVNKYEDEFHLLEDVLYNPKNELKGYEDDYLISKLIDYVNLKVNIDNLQLQMIEEMSNIALNKIKELLASNGLQNHILEVNSSLLIETAFKHSHKENKLDTYLFVRNGEKYDNKIHPSKYKYIKVQNNNFILRRERKKLVYLFQKLTDIILKINEHQNKIELEKLNKKQLSYNKQINILTWIVGGATLLMLVFTILQYFK